MLNKKIVEMIVCTGLLLVNISAQQSALQSIKKNDSDYLAVAEIASSILPPQFSDASVHDPSVIKFNNTYYVFGSHLASAKTDNLMSWTQITTSVTSTNKLITNVATELKETFDWAKTNTLWAPDVIQLQDGKYYMYYCACQGSSPLSALGIAKSDNIEGPYKNIKIILKSGMAGISEDGTIYNVDKHPNAVDPNTFYDADSTNLWMIYGSYSGGIFIIKLDKKTGLPFENQGYGKHLMGGKSSIEGAYVQYSPESKYYYMFTSFGGLGANGGYNIRVVRSKNPDGPYLDPQGNNMENAYGTGIANVAAIEKFGAKLMGNFNLLTENGTATDFGYVSPGHNSTHYDKKTGKYFIIFHTRFPGQGEIHQIRVHQMFINEDEWPVIAPHRYAGETIEKYTDAQICGKYAYVNHGREVTATIKSSTVISINNNMTITGVVTGTWLRSGDYGITLKIGSATYNGVLLRQWDSGLKKEIMTISTLSSTTGIAVWASQLSLAPVGAVTNPQKIEKRTDKIQTNKNNVSFYLQETSDFTMIVFNLNGQIIKNTVILKGKKGLNTFTHLMFNLQGGRYLLKLQQGNDIQKGIVFSND